MKGFIFATFFSAYLAALIPRDGPAHGGMSNKPSEGPKPLTPLGQFLSSITDIEPIVKTLSPIIGPFMKNPATVNKVVDRFVRKVGLHSTSPLEPQLRKNAKRAMFRYGPFTMYGQNGPKPQQEFVSLDPNGQGFLFTITDGLCNNCTVLSGKPGLAFEDGTPASPESGFYIHHILSGELTNPGSMPISQCDMPKVDFDAVPDLLSNLFFRGFIGQGEDNGDVGIMFTSPDGKYNSGFQFGPSHKLLVQADFMNYNNFTKDMYMTIDLEYLDGHVGEPTITTLLSVTGCKLDSAKSNKTATAETNSKKFPILTDGTLLSAKGHLHSGGTQMDLMLNDKTICSSKAVYNKQDDIISMGSCAPMTRVKRGDYITMKSVYDLQAHPTRKDAMGNEAHNIMGGMDLMGMWTMTFSQNASSSGLNPT